MVKSQMQRYDRSAILAIGLVIQAEFRGQAAFPLVQLHETLPHPLDQRCFARARLGAPGVYRIRHLGPQPDQRDFGAQVRGVAEIPRREGQLRGEICVDHLVADGYGVAKVGSTGAVDHVGGPPDTVPVFPGGLIGELGPGDVKVQADDDGLADGGAGEIIGRVPAVNRERVDGLEESCVLVTTTHVPGPVAYLPVAVAVQ